MTALCSLLTILCVIVVADLQTAKWREFDLEGDPVRQVVHSSEITLDLDHAYAQQSGWRTRLWAGEFFRPPDVRSDVLELYGRLDRYLQGSAPSGVGKEGDAAAAAERLQWLRQAGAENFYWRYALLADAAKRTPEARAALQVYEELVPESGFAELLSDELSATADPAVADYAGAFFALNPLPPGTLDSDWSTDEAHLRASVLAGNAETSAVIQRRRLERQRVLLNRAAPFDVGFFVFLVAAIGVIVAVLARRLPQTPLSAADTCARWSASYGWRVLVRAFGGMWTLGLLLVVLLQILVPTHLLWGSDGAVFALLVSIAGLAVVERYLSRPDGRHFWNEFGLRLSRSELPGLAVITLIAVALHWAGHAAITGIARWLGHSVGSVAFLTEVELFGPTNAVGLSFLSVLLDGWWLSVFFFGLFYGTLRRLLAPRGAAVISVALFALGWGSYEFVLYTTWTGIVCMFVYERWRTLWPCVLALGVMVIERFAVVFLLYRLGS